MAWIRKIEPNEAGRRLGRIYVSAMARTGKVYEILKVQSLDPSVLDAWLRLYRAVMFGPSGLTRVEREMVATVVSRTNGCRY